MKIHEATLADVKNACGIYDDDSDSAIENLYMPAALAFIKEYTGLSEDEIKVSDDLTIAYMVLISEMYTQRDYTVTRSAVNPAVKVILSMHSVNNLG